MHYAPSARECRLSRALRELRRFVVRTAVCFAMRRPRLLRAIAATARALDDALWAARRLLGIRGFWLPFLVVRWEHVTGVLSREADFTSAESYAPHILTGPFLLGLSVAPTYATDLRRLHQAVLRSDLDPAAPGNVGARLRVHLGSIDLGEQFDMVDDVAVVGANFVVAGYLGVAAHAELPSWLRRLAAYIVVGDNVGEAARRDTLDAAAQLRAYVAHVVAARRRSPVPADDVLGRLIKATPDDAPGRAWLERNLAGLLWVSHGVVVQAATLAMDEILRHPDALAEGMRAAASGDIARIRGLAFEALRFNPVFPLLPRTTVRDAVLEDSRGRRHSVKAGTGLLLWAIGAMFDAEAVDDPSRFLGSRGTERSLVFGWGPHRCFGEHLARVEIPEILMRALKERGLRLTRGRPRGIVYEGPAVRHLQLACGS